MSAIMFIGCPPSAFLKLKEVVKSSDLLRKRVLVINLVINVITFLTTTEKAWKLMGK